MEGSNQIMWYFANEAVWIDTPGALMEESGRDDWQALIAAMQRVRPGNPADGVAMVVNTAEVLNTDDQGIKELAKKLRSRIDELISLWGIEFPVYLLFNRTDEVPGFSDYFADHLERGNEQIFGATLPAKMLSAMPRMAFIEEFNLLCKSLTDLRLDDPDNIARIESCVGRLGARHGEMPDGMVIKGERNHDGFDLDEPLPAACAAAFAIAGLRCMGTTTVNDELLLKRLPQFEAMLHAVGEHRD